MSKVTKGEREYTCQCGTKCVRAVVWPSADEVGMSRNTYWEVEQDREHEHGDERHG